MTTARLARHVRLGFLFAGVAVLAACGGGGGDGGAVPGPAPTPAPPAAPLTLADCDAKPVGLVNTYLNSTRPTREWRAGIFEGQAVVVREERDAFNVVARRTYYKDDTVARTSTLVARESFDTAGNLERSLKFNDATLPTDLAAGQSRTITYTWDVLFPTGQAGSAETLTLRYDGNEAVNLRNGRVDTCKTTITISDAAGQPVSTETVHATRNASFVKSYLKSTAPGAIDSGQTYMIELDSSTATVPVTAPTALTTPTLADCSAMTAPLDFTLSAADTLEAASARRAFESVSWRGSPSRAMRRANATTGLLQSTTHFDPTIGFLSTLGFESADGLSGIVVSQQPDLRSTPLGGKIDFVETRTPYPSGATSTTSQAFTFHGHERVSTPAGTFDACKVTFKVNGAGGYSDTYWLVPGQSFVRSESVDPFGRRTTRERLAP